MIVFADGTDRSLRGIIDVLNKFEQDYGLAINMSKSTLYMTGKTHSTLQDMAQALGILMEQLPIRYWGLSLTTKSMTRIDYESLIDKIRTRLLSWSSKSLTFVINANTSPLHTLLAFFIRTSLISSCLSVKSKMQVTTTTFLLAEIASALHNLLCVFFLYRKSCCFSFTMLYFFQLLGFVLLSLKQTETL